MAQTSFEHLTQLLTAQQCLRALHEGCVLHTEETYGSHATTLKCIDGRWWQLDSYCPRHADLSDPVNLADLHRVGKALHALFPVTTLGSCIGASIFRPSSAPAATAVLEHIDEMMHNRPPTAARKHQRDGIAHNRESTAPRAAPQPLTSTITVCGSDSPSNPLDLLRCGTNDVVRCPCYQTATGPAVHLPCLARPRPARLKLAHVLWAWQTPVRFENCSGTYRASLAETACLSMTLMPSWLSTDLRLSS